MDFPPHPGQIVMIDVQNGTREVVPADSVPESMRFVYLRQGQAADPETADERVAVVEVRILSLGDKGDLLPPEQATQIWIRSYGDQGRPLGLSIMQPGKP